MTHPQKTLLKAIKAKAKRYDKIALAHDALRYETIRAMEPHQFFALVRSAITEHAINQSYEVAFDEMVDKVVITNANL